MASTIKRFASSLCILLTLTVLLVPVQSFGYQNEVDWMWNDTKPTSKAEPVNDFETLSRPSMSLFEKGERPLLEPMEEIARKKEYGKKKSRNDFVVPLKNGC